jgi:hypothetical protein
VEETLAQAAPSAAPRIEYAQDCFRLEVSPTSEQYRWLKFTEWARYLAGHPLKGVARLFDLPPVEERWNDSNGSNSGDTHGGFQAGFVFRHILAALGRLVERIRKTMSDGKFNVFNQHRLNLFLPRRTSGRQFFHRL